MRVLLVEDDAATAASIELMLRKENFICDTTDLGEDGLEIGKLYDYDIIILDLLLPDIDGYEVLRQLVDNTDEMANLVVAVVASPAFLTDPARGLDAYQALKLRIFDEVRDARRDNPLSALIRLQAARPA